MLSICSQDKTGWEQKVLCCLICSVSKAGLKAPHNLYVMMATLLARSNRYAEIALFARLCVLDCEWFWSTNVALNLCLVCRFHNGSNHYLELLCMYIKLEQCVNLSSNPYLLSKWGYCFAMSYSLHLSFPLQIISTFKIYLDPVESGLFTFG